MIEKEYKENMTKWNDLAYWLVNYIKACDFKIGSGFKAIKVQLKDGFYWVRFDTNRNIVKVFKCGFPSSEQVLKGNFNEVKDYCYENRYDQ
jgi:hypothetical protein